MEYGTPTLAAERGTGVEGVLRIRNHRWNGQFVAYRNQIDNYVYLLAQPDTLVGGHAVSVFRYVQDDATLQGLEVSLEWAARNDLAVSDLAGDPEPSCSLARGGKTWCSRYSSSRDLLHIAYQGTYVAPKHPRVRA